METFWMVWNPQGRAPTVRHETFDAAMNEARRLAKIAPGSQFFILQARHVAQTKDPVEVRSLLEIPF